MATTTIEIPELESLSEKDAPARKPSREESRLRMRICDLEQRLSSYQATMVVALNQVLDLKDLGTGCHSTRLAEWAVRLARTMGLGPDEVRGVEVAALLHDIGKIGVSDGILNKRGPLTTAEMEEMRRHPEYGWAILRLFPDLGHAALFVLHHHERMDGAGYPAGLAAEETPLGARIVSVIDAFDAMISTRAYRRGLPFEEAIRRLIVASGTQFDGEVVEAFLRIARQGHRELAGAETAWARGEPLTAPGG